MSQEEAGEEVAVRWGGRPGDTRPAELRSPLYPPPPTHPLPTLYVISPTMHPSLGLQGPSRLGAIPVHHEIHQEAGQVAHGEVDQLGVPAR